MRCVVFVPGILGSELILNGDQIWPPSMFDAIFGFSKIDELMSDDLKATVVIPKGRFDSGLPFHSKGHQVVWIYYQWGR